MNPFLRAFHSRKVFLDQHRSQNTFAFRLFHGPGDSFGVQDLSEIHIDAFETGLNSEQHRYLWVTHKKKLTPETVSLLEEYCKAIGVTGAVAMDRSSREPKVTAVPFYGTIPAQPIVVLENGIPFSIRLVGSKHPGLFLDLEPLRRKLIKFCTGKTVLNVFAYTGALSVAAAKAGATHVTHVDLSAPTNAWAKDNWDLGKFPDDRLAIHTQDTFDFLDIAIKKGRKFDVVVSDPPSFSRGPKKTFSTSKDLDRLHLALLKVTTPGGLLITNINSENQPETEVLKSIAGCAKTLGRPVQVIGRIDLPPTFPTSATFAASRYLKGFWVRCF